MVTACKRHLVSLRSLPTSISGRMSDELWCQESRTNLLRVVSVESTYFVRSYRPPYVQRCLDTCLYYMGRTSGTCTGFISVFLWVLRLNLGEITRTISARWSFASAAVSTSSKLGYGLTYDQCIAVCGINDETNVCGSCQAGFSLDPSHPSPSVDASSTDRDRTRVLLSHSTRFHRRSQGEYDYGGIGRLAFHQNFVGPLDFHMELLLFARLPSRKPNAIR
ncbi:hypothetical protein EDD15DRAFT_1475531 [Pisolithus albus]|nr:hypothetical protein EDD15DRAFT_1475531 [Pisolithus albus]